MDERNYAAEIRTVIDKMTPDRPYSSRELAEAVVNYLRDADPDLLDGWLYTQAADFIWRTINDRDRSIRSHMRSISRAAEFAADSEAATAGQPDRLVKWLSVPFTVGDGSRVTLAEMKRGDVIDVATMYERRARDNAMTAAFLRVIARRLGDDAKVADVFDDQMLTNVWQKVASSTQTK